MALAASAGGEESISAAILDDGIQGDPGDTNLRILLGRSLEAQGDIEAAIVAWEGAKDWREMLRSGERLMAAGEWTSAVKVLSATRKHLPQETVSPLARALASDRRPADAKDLLAWAIDRWPTSQDRPVWYLTYGDILGGESSWADAATAYEHATGGAGNPVAWKAYASLGRALYKSGRGAGVAMQNIQKSIDLRSGEPDGYLAMADVLSGEGRFSEADHYYLEASSKSPGNVWIWAKRVDNLISASDGSAALQVVNRAIALFPSEAHLYYQQAKVLRRLGQLQPAILAAEMSVKLDNKGDAAYRVSLAELYEQGGQLDRALQEYQIALSLDPTNQQSREAVARLAREN